MVLLSSLLLMLRMLSVVVVAFDGFCWFDSWNSPNLSLPSAAGISDLKLQKRTYQVCIWTPALSLFIYVLTYIVFAPSARALGHVMLFVQNTESLDGVTTASHLFCSHLLASAGENTDSFRGFAKRLMWLSIGCARCQLVYNFVVNRVLLYYVCFVL